MKKVWRLRNDADIEQCLYKLNADSDYIKILLEDDSDPICYLNQNPKPIYIYISYEYDDHMLQYMQGKLYNHWGWFEEEYFDDSMMQEYEFCGEINLRKEKLKKLNELRENI